MTTLGPMDILERLEIGEDASLEVKEAGGKDGEGGLPKSFYPSYVAMANTHGGTIVLGIREKPKGSFTVVGIKNPAAVIKQIWDELNNRHQVNCNILANDAVSIVDVDRLQVIRVRIPRALRAQRPLYVGQNPLLGTYRRSHEGDYLCDTETVKRMLAEQVEQNRDSLLVPNFNLGDIEASTLTAYRQQFKTTKPDHPWSDLGDKEFLRMIGGWTTCRETQQEGLTIAGILMFGKLRSILDAVPHYVLDYQERPDARADGRWIDRVTVDGTWTGNLFDFYRIVIKKLTGDLKVPFKLEGSSRIDDTPVHEALREAFVNTMIHADYTGRVSVLVVKRPDMFGFRNPGLMRVDLDDAIRGGQSDCRNRNLQKMFQLAGLGEQAGSGIPKIWRNWKQQHWQAPQLSERVEPEQTLLALRMVSLLPGEVLDELESRLGHRFHSFSELQRMAVATVCLEGYVTHGQLKSISVEHSRDITITLAGLVREGILESGSVARTTYYFFPGKPPSAVRSFDESVTSFADTEMPASVPFPATSVPLGSVPLDVDSVPLPETSVPSEDKLLAFEAISRPIRGKKKVGKEEIRAAIIQLCSIDFVTLKALAQLLGRSPEYLRIKHLNEMVAVQQLAARFPDTPSHPHQAYRAKH